MPATNEARARAIVAHLSEGTASADEVFAAFEELDRLPADVVKTALEPWTGPAPDLERLDDSLRRAHRLPLRTPRLRVLSSMHDADILDLGDVAEAQIKAAGKTWDGHDLEAFDRLDGERADSWAGSLERRVLGEEGDKPLYDAVLFHGGAIVFRAGTTQVVAVVADQRVESTDRAARPALELALRDHIFAEPVDEEVPSTVTASAVEAPPPPPPDSRVFPEAPPPPSREEPVPSTVAVQVPARDPRQVELPFEAAPTTKPSKKKVAAKKKTAAKKAAALSESEPPPKKKKKAAAAATPAPKKKAAAAPAPKKKTAAKKKKSSKASAD